MSFKKIYIFKLGSTYQSIKRKFGDFDDWIVKTIGIDIKKVKVIKINEGEDINDIKNCAGVILTGSHSMVTQNKEWSLKVEKWIPKLIEKEIPVLGICYGHQLIAKALNGIVDYNSDGEKSGSIKIKLTEESKNDILFSKLPQKFFVNVSHAQSVFSLPQEAKILAYDSRNSIYAFRIGKCTWGVQFHPEFDKNIMMEYMLKSHDKKKNLITKKLPIEKIKNTPYSKKVLKLFYDFVIANM
ncbi:glutamine amidotransferase [Rosettibacter firmus]|uniref:glutamine amidotransferase n=1 Tax=Rosettibacter firmus TaxID=3111522 RepID=UPI00336BEBE1